jgi:hypothetical protein
MDNYIGIDVAKATLQIHIPKGQLDFEIANTKAGLNCLPCSCVGTHTRPNNTARYAFPPRTLPLS